MKSVADKSLYTLRDELMEAPTAEEKLALIERVPEVAAFFSNRAELGGAFARFSPEENFALKAPVALGQGERLYCGCSGEENFAPLLEQLMEIERSYRAIGGIVGYHLAVVERLEKGASERREQFSQPPKKEIFQPDSEVRQAVRTALERMGEFAEVYPIGGAGDRLDLRDEQSGEPLPVAVLPFNGRTLLEGLVRDLQAREYLAFQLTGKQPTVPIVMMTSYEKQNARRIAALCEEQQWFGRPKESFFLFMQPSVPVVTVEGEWTLKGPLLLNCKPGGHGVLWSLMEDSGAFDWLAEAGKKKLLVRQINNPVAGVDYGLLAFSGLGLQGEKKFGFSSCPRLVHAAEGVNVLRESGEGVSITNIEYTEFQKSGIEDRPASEGSSYSSYPANTNILFADIAAVREAARRSPIPGMILNMKNRATVIDADGGEREVEAGRLECTMQNIADVMTDPDRQRLSTFLTDNVRSKTLSVTKNSYRPGRPLSGTPEGAFYTYLHNSHELLAGWCGMALPELPSEEEYLRQGPSFIFRYHPALGPLFEVIAEKLRGGRLEAGSELVLELAEAEIEGLQLDGVLRIEALEPLGKRDAKGRVRYGKGQGRCRLKNVTVENAGAGRGALGSFWKDGRDYGESLIILLHGSGEFSAENVTIKGEHFIEVPDGCRITAMERGGELYFKKETIRKPSWERRYLFDSANKILVN